MSYDTEFDGEIRIRPALPSEFVARWNTAREGTPGRQYVASNQFGPDGRMVHDEPDMLPGVDHPCKPQAWCPWHVTQDQTIGGRVTSTLIGAAVDRAQPEYEEWLQVLIDVIERDLGPHDYQGALIWSGEWDDDEGRLVVERDAHGARVVREWRDTYYPGGGFHR